MNTLVRLGMISSIGTILQHIRKDTVTIETNKTVSKLSNLFVKLTYNNNICYKTKQMLPHTKINKTTYITYIEVINFDTSKSIII